jgi:glycosyltransferase involved in cell wall biosynthesis
MSRYVFDADPRIDLVLHCRPEDEGGNLNDAKSKLTPAHQERVILTRAHDSFTGLGRSELNVLYNAADIYATVSAEGFGLTPAEAAACGVPVVAMDYSTMPEVVGPAGVLVPYAHLIDNEYDHSWAAVDEQLFADAILRLASKASLRRELGRQGPKHIEAFFQWDRAAAQFAELVARATLAEVAA